MSLVTTGPVMNLAASETGTPPHPWAGKRVMVVGAGFTGAVIARELAEARVDVDVIEARGHVGGNAYDEVNEHGIRVHRYGPHLFHTSDMRVVEWLSRFCAWLPYQHRVKAQLACGRYVTLPVNLETAEIVGRDKVLDTFFRPYSRKMWGQEIEELDPSILARVPIRDDLNDLYFPNDTFQALPSGGYTALFNRILDHECIRVHLNTRYIRGLEEGYHHCFNSMPIDEYFGFSLGELPYRSIKFHIQTLPIPWCMPVATVNFTHNGPYTRVTEWKRLPGHGDAPWHTTLTIEEPCDYRENHMERYYPVKDAQGVNRAMVQKYRLMVSSDMTFVGRCGRYAYLDMHQAVSHALAVVAQTRRT
jgi:UDP-galactopyranose mutase